MTAPPSVLAALPGTSQRDKSRKSTWKCLAGGGWGGCRDALRPNIFHKASFFPSGDPFQCGKGVICYCSFFLYIWSYLARGWGAVPTHVAPDFPLRGWGRGFLHRNNNAVAGRRLTNGAVIPPCPHACLTLRSRWARSLELKHSSEILEAFFLNPLEFDFPCHHFARRQWLPARGGNLVSTLE